MPYICNTEQYANNATCRICINTESLDCDDLRLAKYVTKPCIKLNRGDYGGTLLNGSYMIAFAYCIDGIKVSDWYLSNTQAIFEHNNSSGYLNVEISDIDQDFEQYRIAVISIINQQMVARDAGLYSTNQTTLGYSVINNEWASIPISELPISNPVIDRADIMSSVGGYLLRLRPQTKLDFNYQPLANRIVVKWASVEYEAKYYHEHGNKPNFLRDEVYSLFIRWVYDTGDRSASYHIPGRPLLESEDTASASGIYTGEQLWEAYSTATLTDPTGGGTTDDGGQIIAKGYMGAWESIERYPSDSPEIWNGNNNPLGQDFEGDIGYSGSFASTTPLDLCGKPIRHHKMPSENSNGVIPDNVKLYKDGKIRILGIEISNVPMPIDMDGNPITNIVGYEILRGSRVGNKTVLAKGIINRMRTYNDENGNTILYPNYPYNSIQPDPYLSSVQTGNGIAGDKPKPLTGYSDKDITFHSPETNFTNPYLASSELATYAKYNGNAEMKFMIPNEHPEGKLLRNTAFVVALMLGGIGGALSMIKGKKRETITSAYSRPATSEPISDAALSAAALVAVGAINTGKIAYQGAENSMAEIASLFIGLNIPYSTYKGIANASISIPGVAHDYNTTIEANEFSGLPDLLKVVFSVVSFASFTAQYTNKMLDLFYSMIPYRQFALSSRSHCFYNNISTVPYNNRKEIINQRYIGPELVQLEGNRKINNIYRVRTVALETKRGIAYPLMDTTLTTANGQFNLENDFINRIFFRQSEALYVGLKQRIRNLYGKINGIRQIPITSCITPINYKFNTAQPENSFVIFGGDTYVGRYTEKNTFFYFYEWLYKQPDGYQFDYKKYMMLPYVSYWADFNKFDVSDWVSELDLSQPGIGFQGPNSLHYLDGNTPPGSLTIRIGMKDAYFYLFNSGIRDFYVESEYNLAYRDWEDGDDNKKFYSPINGNIDIDTMFDTKNIKSLNFYKYDNSLSIAKLPIENISWGHTQLNSYSPYLAETCYQYYPKRVIYSLPNVQQSLRDNWSVFLPNNYYDFLGELVYIKNLDKTGAIAFTEDYSPMMFQGVDTLQTDSNTKITVGDGGLFKGTLQSISNADKEYEYASCQNRLSVINTPFGIFWINQNQGKVFQYAGGLKEISGMDISWWFIHYLPYRLTDYYPTFELIDNPVSGIGCQSIYDNENKIVYFTKRDYIPIESEDYTIEYSHDDKFNLSIDNGKDFEITLGNPEYFIDCSWTISYDPKQQKWIGWHDWKPDLFIGSKNTFLTTKGNGVWVHNKSTESFCNYYGTNYPFEVEFAINTGQSVNTLRSVEYIMEAYKYDANGYDRHHLLDYNFNEAVVYNSEQVSGELRLNTIKNDPWAELDYPRYDNIQGHIDILCDKNEQKYRFNQFNDITRNRGEYIINGIQSEQMIWNTEENGYIRTLNPNNLDYDKNVEQRKKFRHYMNYVLLRRVEATNNDAENKMNKMLVIMNNSKNLISFR